MRAVGWSFLTGHREREVLVVVTETTEHDTLTPKWDVALEALLTEEYDERGMEMRVADFQRLAREYGIRFDDIVNTLFRMCIEGVWCYRDGAGRERPITQEDYDRLFLKGRTGEEDMVEYDGGWYPVRREAPDP